MHQIKQITFLQLSNKYALNRYFLLLKNIIKKESISRNQPTASNQLLRNMNQIQQNNSTSFRNESGIQKNQIEHQIEQEDYGNQYEQQFEELQKSNDKKTLQAKKVNNNNKNILINPTQSKNTQNQQKEKTKINNDAKIKDQPPSKQNNWNQKPKKQPQNINIQPNIQNNESSIKQNNKNQSQFLQSKSEESYIVENQQPQQQSFNLLGKQKKSFQNSNLTLREEKKEEQKPKIPQKTKQQLLRLCYENQRLTKQLKQKILDSRNEIKNIGNVVDKDIQKSIVKISNKNTRNVNIKHLFSQLNKYKNDQQSETIQKLRQQLKSIRLQSKNVKNQVSIIQNKLVDPVNKQNTLKYEECELKFRLLAQQVQKNIEQKKFMQEEFERTKLGLNLQEQQQFDKSTLKNQETLTKIVSDIKEQRAKLYKQQKLDIQLMQKLKFLAQKDQKIISTIAQIQSEKSLGQGKMSQEDIQKQIKQLVKEINQAFEERNKTESEKYRLLKGLHTQIQTIEQHNTQILTQIRNVDSSLLQFYTHKALRKTSLAKPMPKTAQKLHQTIDSGSPLLRQKDIEKSFQINDKNMVVSGTASNKFRSKIQVKKNPVKQKSQFIGQTQQFNENEVKSPLQNIEAQCKFIDVKSNYNFGDLKVDQKGAILSDEILGKVRIKQIHLFTDNKNCYGIQCKYFDAQKPQIVGMKICEKNADQKCQKISLILNTSSQQQEYISTIKVGYSLKNQIKQIQIKTSLQKTLTWGTEKEVSKTDCKNLDKYSSICIKAKLVSCEQMQGATKSINELMNQKPKLKLAGIGFTVMELKKQI